MVIAILAILTTLILGSFGGIRTSAQIRQTLGTLTTLRTGLAVTAADTGGTVAPSELAIANSAPPRLNFTRGSDENNHLGAVIAKAGDSVSTTGEALVGPQLAMVDPGFQAQTLLKSDVFADTNIPMFYGVQRQYLSRIGASWMVLSGYRRLPKLRAISDGVTTAWQTSAKDSNANGILDLDPNSGSYAPDGNATTVDLYPDRLHRISGDAEAEDQARALERALGSVAAKEDLASAGALYAPANDTQLIYGDRLWEDGKTIASYEPGYVQKSANAWVKIYFRGAAVYDAWDNPILYSLDERGRVRLESAGPDGVFKWDPGINKVIDTAATAAQPSGDDGNGSLDNVVLSQTEVK